MSYTKKDRLIDRIRGNYCDFKSSLRGVSRGKLFDMAGRISAVTEAYEALTTEYDWDEEGEIDFYLLFRDPLTIIADAWESRRNENLIDFDEAMFEISYDAAPISQYPLIEGVYDDIVFIGGAGDDTIRFKGDI